MVGIVLVSENKEAQEMLKTARRLLGHTRDVCSVILRPGTSITQMQCSVKKAVNKMNRCEGILLLTDFYGSTQCNICMKFVKKNSVELVTGFNLPMLVKLVSLHHQTSLKQLVSQIAQYGRKHIRCIRGN